MSTPEVPYDLAGIWQSDSAIDGKTFAFISRSSERARIALLSGPWNASPTGNERNRIGMGIPSPSGEITFTITRGPKLTVRPIDGLTLAVSTGDHDTHYRRWSPPGQSVLLPSKAVEAAIRDGLPPSPPPVKARWNKQGNLEWRIGIAPHERAVEHSTGRVRTVQ